MLFFKKKAEKEIPEKVVPKIVEKVEKPKPVERVRKEIPLFVKLERYDEILSTLNQLKITLQDLSNTLSVLREIDRIREANLRLFQESLSKLQERVSYFDSQFTRPTPLKPSPKREEIKGVEEKINKLKSSLEKIKVELEAK
jgi:hypothetical protein